MDIKAILAELPDQPDFSAGAKLLLQALGYDSERGLPGLSGEADGFIEQFPADKKNTKTEQTFREQAQSVRILFQMTDAEIAAAQSDLFKAGDFDSGNERSFLFAAVELQGASYPRGQYAAFTREINKRLAIATVVLFKTATGHLTLAFVHRRPRQRDIKRDVLGHVSLIREIDPAEPHRAHLDILADLSLPQRLAWMDAHRQPRNFEGLLEAWLKALDTEELNRRFYLVLFRWFNRAVEQAKFPAEEKKTLPPEEHVIRLITRLMFVWFIREKKLIAEDLFIEERIAALLKDYDRDAGHSYYRAVLQNLFFATLNTEIGKRRFSTGKNPTHRDFSRYRFEQEMSDPDALVSLFAQTPFINGGLFDCLDSFDSFSKDGWRIDCFSDNVNDPTRREHGMLSIPNRLFFDKDGLIPLFNRYKFTVEENTPIEQEVALDPELLGKVFENLLAAHNPETRDTARKQTGSYYTPRPVVDYMVDEALVAALAQAHPPTDGDKEFWQERLRYLLDYEDAFNDAHELFDEKETAGIVQAISQLKALDPAVGSGAFPMGILHKLTLALRRLDPDNTRWEALQKALALAKADAALDTKDPQEREAELREISMTFEHYRDSDFGRKLYLIQNSIFGVDIQPIATQIAKLRFFISLAIEQQPTGNPKDNFGIKPLPNLETRFLSANTLLSLHKPQQLGLAQTKRAQQLEDQLAANRERHFHAATRPEKLKCKNKDTALRKELAEELNATGLPEDDAKKIAQWDPYDQNAAADWFDPEYMFGVTKGFDVVIGNPPYIQLQKNAGELGNVYQNAGFETFARTGDIYQLFCEMGCRLLAPPPRQPGLLDEPSKANQEHSAPPGLLSFITSNSWLKAEYGKATRRWLADRHTPLRLLEMGKDVFENAIVDASILIVRSGKDQGAGNSTELCKAVDMDRLSDKAFPPAEKLWGQLRPRGEKPWTVLSAVEQPIMDKMEAVGTPLKEWDVFICRGLVTGCNAAFLIDDATKQNLIAADPKSSEIIKPVLRGRDIQRYQAKWAGLHLIYARKGVEIDRYPAIYSHLQKHQGALAEKAGGNQWYELQASPSDRLDSLFKGEKLFWMDLTEQGRFVYDADEMFCVNTVYMLSGKAVKYLCAVLNSNLITWFMSKTSLTSGMGVTRWFSVYVETLPIPKISAEQQQPFVDLVDRILQAKASDPAADTADLEAEIDQLVYQLYNLTPQEIAAVEGATK